MKAFRIILLAFGLLIALVAGAVGVFTLTERGRENLAGFVSDLISSPDQQISLRGLDGILSGNLRLSQVVVADREGAWLVARGVAVDWSPFDLLWRDFDASRVHVDRIEVARLPLPPETPAPPSTEPFSLPVDIDVAELSLPSIALGGDLAGTVAELAAKGSVRAKGTPLSIDTVLKAERRDGTDGSLDATIAFVPAENRLDIDVKGAEPSGGILATLLGLPGKPAIDLTFSGQGPAADWSGQGSISLDSAVVTTLSGRHRFTEDGSAIEAKGEGQFASFVPEVVRPLLAGATMFDVSATVLDEGRGVRVDGAILESGSVRASASGAIDPNGENDLVVDLAARNGPLRLTVGEGAGATVLAIESAKATVSGAGERPKLNVEAVVPMIDRTDVDIAGLRLSLVSDGFDIATRTGPVSLSATAASVIQGNATLQPLLAGPLSLSANATIAQDLITIADGRIEGAALTGTVDGTVSPGDGAVAVTVAADAAASALPEGSRVVLGDRVTLSGALTRAANGDLMLDALDLKSGPLAVAGSAAMREGAVAADISGSLSDLGILTPNASGAISFAVDASGPLASPEVALTVTGDRVEAAGRGIDGIELKASGTVDLANPAATVSLRGQVEGQPLVGDAKLATTGGERRIDGLSIALGENRITGDLSLDDRFLPAGSLTLNLPDIGPLAALALDQASGAVDGSIVFENDGPPSVAIRAEIPTIARGDISGRAISIDADVEDYVAAPGVSGRIRADEVRSGATLVRAIDVTLTRDGPWTGFDGGATVSDIPAKAAGRVRLDQGATTLELRSANATLRGIATALRNPTTIVLRDGVTRLDTLQLTVGGGNATINGTAGSTLALNVAVASLPAATVNAFAPGLAAEGTVSGTVRVTGAASSPQVVFDVDWANAATSQTRGAGFGALTISAAGTYSGSGVNLQVTAGGGGLDLRGGGSIGIAAPQPLNLSFSGTVPFSFLTARLAQQGLALEGGANIDLRIAGNAGSPQITGTVTSSGARFLDARSGIAVNDLSADVSIAGQTATLRSLRGTLSSGGSLSASGTVGIDPASGFPANLSITVADGRYTDGRTVTANFSGALTVTGPLVSAPVLAGTVTLGRTVITVPERLPGTLARMPVQHRNAPAAVNRQAEALRPAEGSGDGGGGLTLDLEVAAPQEIFVQGRGIDAELGGRIRLTGPSSAPIASGLFEMRRGRLSILGKRLDFTRGNIGFAGSLVPSLDFAATTPASNATTVTVAVTGYANDPKFGFSSSPALPQDEILAQLIFGRGLSNLSPLQIAQLAEAAAQLAGIGGNTTLLESLRNQLGVDDLDVKTDEATGDTSVSVGRYLNDRTYLSIEKGANAGSGKARIDLDIGRGVKLRGEASDAGEAKGGIFYEREY